MTKSTVDAPLTLSVPEAGKKYFDLSRDSSYRAAERGEIPTIRVGRLLRVPVRAMERLLDGVERSGADGALAPASRKHGVLASESGRARKQ